MGDAAADLGLSLDGYDFIDFGCSTGGSISFASKKLGGKHGLGIDISDEKVNQTRKAGFDAVCADARTLALHPGAVSFVTMLDFLEHLPGITAAKECIRAATVVARDFVFIRQPWFDSDGYLLTHGLKLYWSDWSGHPNAMTTLEFHKAISRMSRVKRWRMYGKTPIKDSANPSVHSIASSQNQHVWMDGVHPPKPDVKFDQPVFAQIGCILELHGGQIPIEDVEKRAPWSATLFSSDALDLAAAS